MSTERGHRTVPHTADVIVEAWGPDRAACLEESVHGAVEMFAVARDRSQVRRIPIGLEAAGELEQLVALLEEVIYVVDVFGVVPVEAALEAGANGSLTGCFDVVPSSAVDVVGAAPKGVSRSDLMCERVDRQWRARVLLDV